MKYKIVFETEAFETNKLPFNQCTTVKVYDLTEDDIDSLLEQIGEAQVKRWLDEQAK